MYDIVIIGAGISGCAIAYELGKYELNVLMLEKENDVSVGTTKANSGIIHAGYDPIPNTRMAKYNVSGNLLAKDICEKLDVPFKQIGSLVIAFDEDDMHSLNRLYNQGSLNGVPELKILNRDELFEAEKNISRQAIAALYAPTAGIVSPWEFAIAMAETAVKNGVELRLNQQVKNIANNNSFYTIITENNQYDTKYIINASGIFADDVNEMVNPKQFTIKPNKGEYYILDKNQGNLVNHIIFECPTSKGKGVLVSPTVHGNLIVGPNSNNTDRYDLSTSDCGLKSVKEAALKSVLNIDYSQNIRNFSGLRANTDIDDFIVNQNGNFFNVAGIKSPGLSSAPAIAIDIVDMLVKAGLKMNIKKNYVDTRKVIRFRQLNDEQKKQIVKQNPLYGKIVCRCETVTEGEIIDALNRSIVSSSIDGIKRRCNTGMGRCQGGFCKPKVQQIISEYLNIPFEDVLLDRVGTKIVIDKTKSGGNTCV